MHRRALLASSASLLVWFAGCQSASSDEGPAESMPSDTSTTPTETETATATPESTPTPEPSLVGDPPGDSRFIDESCPGTVDGCYHEATVETPVYVRPSTEQVEMGGRVEFSLVNRTRKALSIGPYHWDVWRDSEDGWESVDPREYVEDLGAWVESGDEYTWAVLVDTEGDRTMSSGRAAVGVTFETGRYCFGIKSVGSQDGSENYGTVGALFEVVGP